MISKITLSSSFLSIPRVRSLIICVLLRKEPRVMASRAAVLTRHLKLTHEPTHIWLPPLALSRMPDRGDPHTLNFDHLWVGDLFSN